jgi:hypothetical protein
VKPSSLKPLCKVPLPQAIIQCHRLEQFEKDSKNHNEIALLSILRLLCELAFIFWGKNRLILKSFYKLYNKSTTGF